MPLLVDASGNPQAVAEGLRLLAHEGTALIASWFGTKDVPLPLGGEFHRRRLSLSSSQVSTIPARLAPSWTIERRRRLTVRLLRSLPLAALATHEFQLSRASEAFAAVDRGDRGMIHVALRYGEAHPVA